ncbi:MAG: IclR family transcriptional regulator [Spirochaetales bacterium]|nr:IclR family transcriptional regulator [Spirochaetales bacterium]
MTSKAVKKNLSIGKALQIIETMAGRSGPMRLQEVANAVSQPPSTTLRFLNTLMDFGYADQDPTNLHYFLTMKFCRIGNLISRQIKMREVIRPFLEVLSRKFEESTCLAISQEDCVVYIDVVDGPDHILQALQRIGKIAPLHSTGVGKCLLLDYTEGQIAKFAGKGLAGLTKNTIKTESELLTELAKVRRQGYGEDNEECEIGVRCVAAPIRDYSGKVVAAISTSGPTHRLNSDKLKLIRAEIPATAQNISKRLGYDA